MTSALAEDLERFLGDPGEGSGPLSFAASLAHDERDAFPQDGCDALAQWGYLRHLVPEGAGGALASFASLLDLGRVVARRDLTVAIATGQTLLGALPVWIDGTEAQRARVAALAMEGSAGCLALTEEAHGSDLTAGDVTASIEGDALALAGEKWCINNATRGGFLTTLARTRSEGGLRGFSVVLVDKAHVDASAITPLPKILTHGIRGADISGLRFEHARLPRAALVGKEGHGLDLVLKVLQVSRTMCAAFSLGAGDTALRFATRFAQERVLYGAPAVHMPVVRRALAEAFANLVAVDALARVACRALSLAPEAMSVVSAVVKYAVPTTVDALVRSCGGILGARHYLRVGPYAAFQKLRRDHAVVGLFDGSTAVNLYVLASQLPRLAEVRAEGPRADPGALFAVDQGVPPMTWNALRTSSRGLEPLVASLAGLLDHPELAREDAASREIRALAIALDEARRALDREAIDHAKWLDYAPNDATSFTLARRYTAVATGSAALGAWLFSRGALEAPLAEGSWLAVALARLLAIEPSPRSVDASFEALRELAQTRRTFALQPFALAP